MSPSKESARDNHDSSLQAQVPSTLKQLWEIFLGSGILPVNVQARGPNALAGQTIIIIGATRGIGYEAVKGFLSFGASRVIIGARLPKENGQAAWDALVRKLDAGDGQKYKGKVEVWEVDYASFESVRAFADKWEKEGKPLHAFVSNVGMCTDAPIKTKDGWDLHYQTNYLSHFLTTFLVLPSLQRAESPRVVLTTSVMHWLGPAIDWRDPNLSSMTDRDWKNGGMLLAYSRPKLFLNMFARELQDRLDRSETKKHIQVLAVHPGNTDTDMYRKHLNFQGLYEAFRSILLLFVCLIGNTSANAGRTLVKALVSDAEDRGREGRGGRYWSRGQEGISRFEARDEAARKKLWERSRLHAELKDDDVEL